MASEVSNPAASSEAAGTPRAPLRKTFPARINSFPRTCWKRVIFSYPNYRPGDLDLKAKWAARAASNKWIKAFDDNSMDGVDKVDFAVAVLAKASEMNEYIRIVQFHHGTNYRSTERWLWATDKMIVMAFDLAWKHITKRFPDLKWDRDDLKGLVPEFVRPALNCLWKDFSDSHHGGRPLPNQFDAVKFTDRYLPGPDDPELAPRPYTEVNFKPGAKLVVKWLDYKFEEVPPPQWWVDQQAKEAREAREAKDDGSDDDAAQSEGSGAEGSEVDEQLKVRKGSEEVEKIVGVEGGGRGGKPPESGE